jgi:hypothetical protein
MQCSPTPNAGGIILRAWRNVSTSPPLHPPVGSARPEPLIPDQRRFRLYSQPEPLVPEPMSLLADFGTIRPVFGHAL